MPATNPSTRGQDGPGFGLSGTAKRALGHSGARLEQQDQENSHSGYPGAKEIPNSKSISQALKHVIINQRKGLRKMYGETEAELDESLKTPIKKGGDGAEVAHGDGV